MTMAQPSPAHQTVREEERVLGISFERALAMIPRLVRDATGAEVQALGDGYFVGVHDGGNAKRELTIRLGRQGPDTRFSVRVESHMVFWIVFAVILVGIATVAIGLIPLIPWLQSVQRREARERELLVHRIFRAIEDAVAEQGVSKGYRIAPGADAVMRENDQQAAHDEATEERRMQSGAAG